MSNLQLLKIHKRLLLYLADNDYTICMPHNTFSIDFDPVRVLSFGTGDPDINDLAVVG